MTTIRSMLTATAAALTLALFAVPASAQLGLKDCSDKYSAEKAKDKNFAKSFADYQKTECGPGAKPAAAPAAKPAAAATPPAAAPATPAAKVDKAAEKAAAKAARAEKRKADKAAAAAASAAAAKLPVQPAVFPTAVSAKFKDKKPSKARFATCLEQYRTNKATNANGGLKWIQKGGGFYAQCNKKLKG